MSRIFFAKSDTERKREKRAAKRDTIIAAAVESSSSDTSDDEMNLPMSDPSLQNDYRDFNDLIKLNKIASQQENNSATNLSSSSEEDDADLDELIRATDVSYQCKVYANSFLSIHDACELIIKLSRRLNLDKNKAKILLHGIRLLLPNDNKLPRTLEGLLKVLGINNNKKVVYHCTECLTYLNTPQETKCSSDCQLNNKYRSFSNVSELTINDVKSEISSTIERYANVILDYRNRSNLLLPCDVPNAHIYQTISSTTSIKSSQNQVTVMLHTDGAPVTKFR
ncbi:unnamed protein product, partial [Rotaria sp. Silwood2]